VPLGSRGMWLWALKAATLVVTVALVVSLLARLGHDAGDSFLLKWARERWFWALQKTVRLLLCMMLVYTFE